MADVASVDVAKLKVADLKKELKARGLSVTGNKTELVERLQTSIQSSDVVGEDVDDKLLDEDPALDEEPAVNTSVVEEPPVPDTSTAQSEEKESGEGDVKKTVLVTAISDADRQKLRASKFGIVSEEQKKQLRAEKFGLQTVPKEGDDAKKLARAEKFNIVDSDAKKQARAERFGLTAGTASTANTATAKSTTEMTDKMKQRMQRFGIDTTNSAQPAASDKLQKRKDRFNSSPLSEEAEAKKRKRAERFGLTT